MLEQDLNNTGGDGTPISFTSAEIRHRYDRIAPRYDLLGGILEILGIGRLRGSLLRRASGRVLEVAAGTGRGFPYYSARCKITAVDLSPGMLRIARKRARRRHPGVTLRVADALELPFASGSFDTIVSCLSLCTFPEPVATLREMARVCRGSGRVLLLEHGRSDRERVGSWQDRKADGHARFLGCQWNREPLALLREAGLTPVAARRFFLGIFHEIEALPTNHRQPGQELRTKTLP